MPEPATLWLWRHPRPRGGAGRCYGRSDLPVDPRKAKRLAHRLRRATRRHGLPRIVWTSPLARCRAVGRWLRRWGFEHRVDARLAELDFGGWEGRPWREIPREEIDAWVQGFATQAPGGGESLQQFSARVQSFVKERCDEGSAALLVAHGGWMAMARWQQEQPQRMPSATEWPGAPGYGVLWRL